VVEALGICGKGPVSMNDAEGEVSDMASHGAHADIRGDSPLGWWQGHHPFAVLAVMLLVSLTSVPSLVGELRTPVGQQFTGAATYPEDVAQHETFAAEMATHLRYRNLLTPEPTQRGWFFTPLEFTLGFAHRVTGISYTALGIAIDLACAPALAFALMALARRIGLDHPGAAALIALLAGSFAPLVLGAARFGLTLGDPDIVRRMGGDATPNFAGVGLYLLLTTLVLIALPGAASRDPARGFRRAGVALFALATIYPFFIPTLLLTVGLCALLWARQWGWRPMLGGVGWLGLFSAPPIVYWAVLPRVDSEYARFAASDRIPLLSPFTVLVSLGLGVGAIAGVPRLLRGNVYQQMLACFSVALVVALYIPAHPWRSHLFYLSPVLVIAALAAWWPFLLRVRPVPRWLLVGCLLIAATVSLPYYDRRNFDGLAHTGPPTYLTDDDVAAIRWIAGQPGDDVVLARTDVSPWVAARAQHRVVVGHYLWTHDYQRRRSEVEAIFAGSADPRPLLRAEHVAWILIDEERGTPPWARDVEPAARFGQTVVLRADPLLAHLEEQEQRTPPAGMSAHQLR